MVGLINRRQVFYAKAYDGRATFLSVRIYHLLKRCIPEKLPGDTAKRIYKEIIAFDCVEKAEVRNRLEMNKRDFGRGFD